MKFLYTSLLLAASLSHAMNYSAQLMEFTTPKGWSAEQWAGAADDMITKTSGRIITELIEDLSIRLKLSEDEIRQMIDEERIAIDLDPLPPYEEEEDISTRLNKMFGMEEGPDYGDFLPASWTEVQYGSLSEELLKELSDEDLGKLSIRAEQEDAARQKDHNSPDYFETLPKQTAKALKEYMHEHLRQSFGLPEGARAYKRNVASVVQAVAVMDFEKWGYVLYRTTYKDEAAWEDFMKQFRDINDRQIEHPNKGEGMQSIKDHFEMFLATDGEVEDGASFSSCVDHFLTLQEHDVLPPGVDIPMILVVDEASLSSVTNFQHGTRPFVWAVDATYDASKQSSYPDGYKGFFKVHYMAPIHELYPAIASHFMEPAELWALLQADPAEKGGLVDAEIEARARGIRDAQRYKKAGLPSDRGRGRPTQKDEL